MTSKAGAIRAGRAYVEAFLDSTLAEKNLKQLQAKFNRFADNLGKVGGSLLGFGTAILVPMAASIKMFAAAGDELDKMSKRTGVAVETLSALEFAASQSGASLADVEAGMKGMARFSLGLTEGLSTAAKELEMLGINADEFKRLAPEDRFMKLAGAVFRDPSQAVNLSKDRKYRILVQDRYRRGGAKYRYVLEVRPSKPDFYAAVIHSSNPNPAGTTLFKGTAGYMDVVLHQKGGYNGEVTIGAEGLPTGVHCAPTTINNNNRGTLVFWAEDSAVDWTGFTKLFATGERDGEPFRREVRYYSRVWNNSGTSRPSRQLALAVREQGPFDLEIQPGELQVESGETADLKLSLRRLWPDFKDKVTIQPLSFPGNFKLGNFDINKDQTEADLKIEVQQNTRPGRYTLAVLGQAQVPFNKDPKAEQKPNTLVSTPARPITIVVTKPAAP